MIISIKRIKYLKSSIINYFSNYLYDKDINNKKYINSNEHLYLIYDIDNIIGSFSIIKGKIQNKSPTLQDFFIINEYRGFKLSIYVLNYIKNNILNNRMKYIFIDVLKSNCIAYNTYKKYTNFHCFLDLYFFTENYGFTPHCDDEACRFILQK
jgi:hypothetical protein